MPKGVASFSLVCFILAPIVFFIGTIVYNVMMGFDDMEKPASYTQLGTGFLATLLFGIGANALFIGEGSIANIITSNLQGNADHAQFYANLLVTFAFFGQIIVFGLMPLLKGINKTFIVTPEVCDECNRPHTGPRVVVVPTPAILDAPAKSSYITNLENAQAVTEKPKRASTPRVAKPKVEKIEPAEMPAIDSLSTPAVEQTVEVEVTSVDGDDDKPRKARHR